MGYFNALFNPGAAQTPSAFSGFPPGFANAPMTSPDMTALAMSQIPPNVMSALNMLHTNSAPAMQAPQKHGNGFDPTIGALFGALPGMFAGGNTMGGLLGALI